MNDQRLYVVADEKRFDLGNGAGKSALERLDFKIRREDLDTLANAKEIDIKIAERVFKIKPSMQTGFRNILALGTL